MTPEPYPSAGDLARGDPLRRLRLHLLEAGCGFDFRRRAWRCPSCRRAAALRAFEQADGSLRLVCAGWGCSPGHILAACGLTYLDVGPAAFRSAS